MNNKVFLGGRWAQGRFWGAKTEPNGPTWDQQIDQTKTKNIDVQKRSLPGHPTRFGGIGPERLFPSFMLKHDGIFSQSRCQHSSKVNAKTCSENDREHNKKSHFF